MRRALVWLILLGWVATVGAATQTITTPLPDPRSSAFRTQLQTFLGTEDARRTDRMIGPFVSAGGIGLTNASLTHTIAALEGFVHGYFVSQASTAHTYTASRTTYVYADSVDTRSPEVTFSGGTGCTFHSRQTRLVSAECSSGSVRPTASVNGLLLLQAVTTDATTISSVIDHRPTNPWRPDVINVRDPLIGAKCDGNTDDSVSIQNALSIATQTHRRVELPANAACLVTTAIILKPEVDLIGYGRDSSIIKVVGAGVRGLVFEPAAFAHAAFTLKGFRVLGDTTTGTLVTIDDASMVTIEDIEIFNSGAGGLLVKDSVDVHVARVFVQNYVTHGIHVNGGAAWSFTGVNVTAAGAAGGNAFYCELSSFGTIDGESNFEGLHNGQNAVNFNGCGNVRLQDSYIELFTNRAVVFTGAASRQITVENMHLNADTEPLIDASGILVHERLNLLNNVCVGFGGGPFGAVTKCFDPGASVSFKYLDNTFGGSTMDTHVVGYLPESNPFATTDVVKSEINPVHATGFRFGLAGTSSLAYDQTTNKLELAAVQASEFLNLFGAGTVLRLDVDSLDVTVAGTPIMESSSVVTTWHTLLDVSEDGIELPVITTANLPAAGAGMDGHVVIEDGGAGIGHLVFYKGGQRFRLNGGSPF